MNQLHQRSNRKEFNMSQAQAATRIGPQVHKPVHVADESEAGNAAFDGLRRRPVLARNGDQLLVCCSRMAKKHGWAIVGHMFQR